MKRTAAAFAILAALAGPAAAGVAYQWQPGGQPDFLAGPTAGRLVIDDAAVAAGSLDYRSSRDGADGPIDYLQFRSIRFDGAVPDGSRLNAALQFTGDTLSGWLSFGNGQDNASMTGGPLWSVVYAADNHTGCMDGASGRPVACRGFSGTWIRDRADSSPQAAVDAPSSIALAGLGLLALAAALRKRSAV